MMAFTSDVSKSLNVLQIDFDNDNDDLIFMLQRQTSHDIKVIKDFDISSNDL